MSTFSTRLPSWPLWSRWLARQHNVITQELPSDAFLVRSGPDHPYHAQIVVGHSLLGVLVIIILAAVAEAKYSSVRLETRLFSGHIFFLI